MKVEDRLKWMLQQVLGDDFKLFIACGDPLEVIVISNHFLGLSTEERYRLIEEEVQRTEINEARAFPPLGFLLRTPKEWEQESRLDQ